MLFFIDMKPALTREIVMQVAITIALMQDVESTQGQKSFNSQTSFLLRIDCSIWVSQKSFNSQTCFLLHIDSSI